jgi:glycerophosphoryl diester phosphodiesterase
VSHPALPPGPVAIAHRGGSLEAEENTLEAFAYAVGLGFRDIETDVHATRDGVAVIHHDTTLGADDGGHARHRRDGLGGGGAGPHPWRRGHPAGGRGAGGLPGGAFRLRAEGGGAAAALAPVLRGELDRVAVGGFEPRHTAEARARLGDGLLWSPGRRGVLGLWLRGWGLPLPRPGFRVVHVPPVFRGIPVVTPRFVRAAARAGVAVQVWTVDEAGEMERLLDMGVHGVMTDRPSVLRAVMRARGVWRDG